MTTVVVWAGVDQRAPASLYMATDSRISWKTNVSTRFWDSGRKTWASKVFPDIACFCGAVLFPTVALSQYFDGLDAGVVTASESSGESRFKALEQQLRLSFNSLAEEQRRSFTIIYGSRQHDGMSSEFSAWSLSWRPDERNSDGTWARSSIDMPASSAAIKLDGSGQSSVADNIHLWDSSTEGGTSRAVFGAFVNSLSSGADRFSGGAPQLVGLYRQGSGQTFGVIVGDKRFYAGAPVTATHEIPSVEWRNELFERSSSVSRRRLFGAQRHRDPFSSSSQSDE